MEWNSKSWYFCCWCWNWWSFGECGWDFWEKTHDKEIQQKSYYTVEIYGETLEGDELYVVDEVESESAYDEIEVNDVEHNYGRTKAESPTIGHETWSALGAASEVTEVDEPPDEVCEAQNPTNEVAKEKRLKYLVMKLK